MSQFLKRSVTWGALWCSADFLAQFYVAHLEAARRRARGEKSNGRPSGQQMAAMLDKEQLAQSTAFGVVAGPLTLQYQHLMPRIFGPLAGRAAPCLCALGLQQLILSPALLLAYFGSMTAARGGFEQPSFLAEGQRAGRQDAFTVVRYILSDVLPQPLLLSWAVAVPWYALQYAAPTRGAGVVAACLLLPWTANCAYTQKNLLL